MERKIFFKVASFIFALTLILTAKVSAEGIWRLDGDLKYELPRNFRILEDLKMSASGQPSTSGLLLLYNELRQKTDGNIYIIDLREESHGFANGFPVSLYTEKNLANFFTPRNQIEEIEIEQLTDMLDRQIDFLPLGNEDKKLFKPINVLVKNVETEHQKADEIGFIYVRFPVTDMFFPQPEIVEQFMNFVANLRENDWVHFHCQAGHGRTTTFMVMYEILKRPEITLGDHPEKELEKICRRNAEMGGSDLLKISDGDKYDYYVQAQNSRAAELRKFYDYITKINRGYIDISWSEYAK